MVKRWARRLVLGAIGLGLLAALVYAFMPRPVAVDIARAGRGPLRVTVDEDGRTRIKDRYVVAAPLAGRLSRIRLKAGEPVEAGKTTIAVMEPTDPALLDARAHAEADARVKAAEKARERANTQLERARAAESLCRSNLERAKRMYASRSMSEHEFEDFSAKHRTGLEDLRAAEFDIQIRDYELDLARAALLRTRPTAAGGNENGRFYISSPIDGVVLRVLQESETVALPGLRLVELGDPKELEIEIDVLSADAVKVQKGARIYLEHWGGDEPLLARVRRVEPAGFTKISALGVEEQRVWIIADFDEPADKRKTLGDAYRVEARIVVWESADVLKIPAGALFRNGDGWAVFTVSDGKAMLRPVRVGHTNGIETEILDGLAVGDEVIVHPGDKVKDGVPVVPR
jgi:HlyD family secretion protein